ncbi:MAG: AraC family transcriptional regulator [Gemmiger formicilis]|uniref:AraC family transcriptional regulator n=1 Tax=Gemmiger formicilis TaxID=745368 RepID=UPI0039A1464F
MDVFQNMELFSELIQCGGNIYTWCYNADGSLLQSNCPEAGFLSGAFDLFGCKKKMLDYGSRHTKPVTLGTAIGMTWAAAFEKDGSALKRAWVIGPVFYQDVSLRGIEQGLQYYNRLETSVAWTMQLYEALKTVPVLQCTVLHRYALMMHYCLTGNHLTISDINSEDLTQVRNAVQQPAHDRHKVWMAEQGLLQMVRTGDLNYKQALSASMGISAGVPVRSDDALRQSKTSIIVFTSLVCRAAIEGGLSPEEAYALGDSYIQSAENAKTMDDLDPLALMMYDDFVRRVHKCRTNPHLSQQVQKCVDYIEMNLDKKYALQILQRWWATRNII